MSEREEILENNPAESGTLLDGDLSLSTTLAPEPEATGSALDVFNSAFEAQSDIETPEELSTALEEAGISKGELVEKTTDLYSQLDPNGKKSLIALIEKREESKSGESISAILATDSTGTLVIENLIELSKTLSGEATLDESIELDANELINSLLKELDNPKLIRQGAHATCCALGLQVMLVEDHLAEYVRMSKELFLTGESTLPGSSGNDIILRIPEVPPIGIEELQTNNFNLTGERSANSMIFQSAAMQLALDADGRGSGYEASYNYRNDTITYGGFEESGVQRGLTTNQYERAAELLTGEALVRLELGQAGVDSSILQEALTKQIKNSAMLVTFKTGDSNIHMRHAVAITDVREGKVFYTDGRYTDSEKSMSIERFIESTPRILASAEVVSGIKSTLVTENDFQIGVATAAPVGQDFQSIIANLQSIPGESVEIVFQDIQYPTEKSTVLVVNSSGEVLELNWIDLEQYQTNVASQPRVETSKRYRFNEPRPTTRGNKEDL